MALHDEQGLVAPAVLGALCTAVWSSRAMSTGSASPRHLPDESRLAGLAQVVLGGLLVLVGQPDVVTELVRRDLGDVEAAVKEVVVLRVR